jgi:hypothetical protein
MREGFHIQEHTVSVLTQQTKQDAEHTVQETGWREEATTWTRSVSHLGVR